MIQSSDRLEIGNKSFNSRLMLGTGKYRTLIDTVESINSSECEIVTVAVRRLPINLQNDNITFLNSFRLEKIMVITKYCRISNC